MPRHRLIPDTLTALEISTTVSLHREGDLIGRESAIERVFGAAGDDYDEIRE